MRSPGWGFCGRSGRGRPGREGRDPGGAWKRSRSDHARQGQGVVKQAARGQSDLRAVSGIPASVGPGRAGSTVQSNVAWNGSHQGATPVAGSTVPAKTPADGGRIDPEDQPIIAGGWASRCSPRSGGHPRRPSSARSPGDRRRPVLAGVYERVGDLRGTGRTRPWRSRSGCPRSALTSASRCIRSDAPRFGRIHPVHRHGGQPDGRDRGSWFLGRSARRSDAPGPSSAPRGDGRRSERLGIERREPRGSASLPRSPAGLKVERGSGHSRPRSSPSPTAPVHEVFTALPPDSSRNEANPRGRQAPTPADDEGRTFGLA